MDAYSLGQFLRSSRESKEIELSEVVAKLRIRQPILEAFEAGDFAATDMSDIQVRGMLRNYARFLELDEDDVLRLYDDARFGKGRRGRWPWHRDSKSARGSSRRNDAPLPMQEIDVEQSRSFHRRRLWGVFALLVVSIAAIVTIAFVTMELVGPRSAAGSAGGTAEAIAQIVTPPFQTAEPAPTIVPTVATPTPVIRSRYSGGGVLVNILVTQRNWMRIISDGVERFAGIAVPDTVHEFDALSEIILSASNAKGLDIEWNSQQQPSFGGRGQRVDIRFTATNIAFSVGPGAAPTLVSPTTLATGVALMTIAALTPSDTPGPSPTPTWTLVPTVTLTFTPSPTIAPSITPTASETPTVTDAPTITLTPTETAILPPRVTQEGLKPKKEGA